MINLTKSSKNSKFLFSTKKDVGWSMSKFVSSRMLSVKKSWFMCYFQCSYLKNKTKANIKKILNKLKQQKYEN